LQYADVAASLQKQIGRFLRRKRGDKTYAHFARQIGLSASSLQRMELGQQNVTVATLEFLLKRFKCRITDIFDSEE